MDKRKLDYIIVGQGIAGSWLAQEFLKREKKIAVINHDTKNTSSLKAAGLYNPITGRKMVKTWLAEELFTSIEESYQTLESQLNKKFLHSIPIYRPFQTIEDKNDWEGKIGSGQYSAFVKSIQSKSSGMPGIQDELGGIIINKSGYVDLPTLLESFKEYLRNKGVYHSEMFDYSQMEMNVENVIYKNWVAKKVIFCEGATTTNPYWDNLPFKFVRGEIIDMECGLASNYIINRGVFMIPKNGYYTVGSTYDHNHLSYEPHPDGILNLKQRLSKLFAGTYRIIDKRAGVRPATFDRKPFIGIHQKFKTLGIFNGFGTKGVSLTPYFASQFADYLEGETTINDEANVQRVY